MFGRTVYKIKCNDCEATYIGQTKRQLGTRINEHIKDINKKSGSLSVISDHRLDNDHEMNWRGVEIVDTEPSYGKRLISEMIYIKKQSHGLNKQSDTELLSDLPIIELLLPTLFPFLNFSPHPPFCFVPFLCRFSPYLLSICSYHS